MLHDLQRSFARAIIAWELPVELADSITPNAKEGEERFCVYRNTFIGALTNVLRLNFPAVERLVGRDCFDGAAARFALAHPPASAYLNEFGAEFPGFLATLPAVQSLSYLPGVARLDWAFSQALHAPDAPSLDLAALARSDSDDVWLVLHPAVHLLREALPVDEIWRAVLAGDEGALAAIELRAETRFLLIERPGMEARVERLDATDWALLDRLRAGFTLRAALEEIDPEEAPRRLARHLASGRISAVETV